MSGIVVIPYGFIVDVAAAVAAAAEGLGARVSDDEVVFETSAWLRNGGGMSRALPFGVCTRYAVVAAAAADDWSVVLPISTYCGCCCCCCCCEDDVPVA